MINLCIIRCLLIKVDAHKTYFKTNKCEKECEYLATLFILHCNSVDLSRAFENPFCQEC